MSAIKGIKKSYVIYPLHQFKLDVISSTSHGVANFKEVQKILSIVSSNYTYNQKNKQCQNLATGKAAALSITVVIPKQFLI